MYMLLVTEKEKEKEALQNILRIDI